MAKLKFNTRYQNSSNVKIVNDEPSLTEQHHKEKCDIRTTLATYDRTGIIQGHKKSPMYGDFTQIPNYQESLDMVINAQKAFDSLPSNVRQRFKNPKELLRFLEDPENTEEAQRLGLVNPPSLKDQVELPSQKEESTQVDIEEAISQSESE